MRSYTPLKPQRAVCVIANDHRLGTLARRKITLFRKFLLESNAYPEEMRREWTRHENTLQESLLMAYVYNCKQLIVQISSELDRLTPVISRKDVELRHIYNEISRLDATTKNLQKTKQKQLEHAKNISTTSLDAKAEAQALLSEVETQLARFHFDFQDFQEALEKNQFLFLTRSEATKLKSALEKSDFSTAFASFIESQPEYKLLASCANILRQETPFDLFLQQATKEGISISKVEDLLHENLSTAQSTNAEKIISVIISAELQMKRLTGSLDKLSLEVKEKLNAHISFVNKLLNNEVVIYSKDEEGTPNKISANEQLMLLSRLTDSSNMLTKALSLALTVKQYIRDVRTPQTEFIKTLAKYLHVQNQLNSVLEKRRQLSEKLIFDQDYWHLKAKQQILLSRLSKIRSVKEKAQDELDELLRRCYIKESKAKLRKESAQARLISYFARLEQEDKTIQVQFQDFSGPVQQEESQIQDTTSTLCLNFVSEARKEFKDFLKAYPQQSEAFDRTLFNLAKIFIESGGYLDRNKLTLAFPSRIRQEYLPNTNAVLVRLGMLSSNEYRFLLDITESKHPIILFAGIKAKSKRFMKRLVQGSYYEERSKALSDGRGRLFLLLKPNNQS
ncbi:MAG: hypothetical protein QXN37_00595 [Candidatus Anstonellaceae archaeon]